jgi:hypothetical protein
MFSSQLPSARSSSHLGEGPLSFVLPKPDNFAKLVNDLSRVLGPSSGINSDDVDVEELKELMRQYTSDPGEWGMYALGDISRAYTRNLVDRGNGKSNLVGHRHSIAVHYFNH